MSTPERLRECRCGCGRDPGLYARTERGHVSGEVREYLPGHRGSTGAIPAEVRLRNAIEGKSVEGCWEWPYALCKGYGRLSVDGRRVPAHRFAYEQMVGPIPDGLVIDHLCRNKACVNPDHLEPVTNRENVSRGDSAHIIRTGRCKRGHLVAGSDRWVDKTGRVHCLACHRERRRIA